MLNVLSLLIEATYANRGKLKLLTHINTQLTVLRHLWRLSFELTVIAIAKKQYNYGSQLLVTLGNKLVAGKNTPTHSIFLTHWV